MPAWYGQSPIRSLVDYLRRVPGAPAFVPNAIMLTIDDGPHPVWTPKILRLLQKYQVKATFCIIGRQATTYPDLLRAAVADGHHLANHSYSHPSRLPWLSPAAMSTQVVDTQDAIVRASGFTPRQFRAPGGQWSPALTRLAAMHDLLCVDWDVDPRDWSKPGTPNIIKTMLKARAGDVLLCHDGGGDRSQTYAALQAVLPTLKARGLRFVTLPAPQPLP
ncbi:MAG: polysaccharide deacetylase family protein [Actinomycetota bacterium]|nr:polysaccharide deacetylase family protein [Actinomycetota bacterium]